MTYFLGNERQCRNIEGIVFSFIKIEDYCRMKFRGFFQSNHEFMDKGKRIGVVDMMESVQTFITKINEQNHVLQLIKNIDYLSIRLVAEGSSISFAIANQNVFILQNVEEEMRTCEIYGGINDIEDLLKGKEKLRSLVKRGRLRISAPFRVVLMLESLFYLAYTKVSLF